MKTTLKPFIVTLSLLLISSSSAIHAEEDKKKGGIYQAVELHEREVQIMAEAGEFEARFLERGYLLKDPKVERWINGIAQRLVPEVHDSYIQYRVLVLRDPTPAALGLPNGQVYVNTGMLAMLENEAQLAGVLAHEIMHVAGHHGILAFRSQRKKSIVKVVLTSVDALGLLGDIGNVAVSITNQFLALSLMGYHVRLEDEAERYSLRQLRKGGYNLAEQLRVFEILGKNPEGEPPPLATKWNSSAKLRSRAQSMSQRLANLLASDETVIGREDYRVVTRRIALMTVEDHIRNDYPRTAISLARRLIDEGHAEAEAWLGLGDGLRALGPRSEVAEKKTADTKVQKKNARNRALKTRAERDAELLKTAQGRADFNRNMSEALDAYRHALGLDGQLAEVHRGLGYAHLNLEHPREAAGAFLAYLKLRPKAPDRVLIMDELKRIHAQLQNS